MLTREELGSRVKREREARGWAMSELAAASSVSKAMISKIERGESSPTAAVLGRLSGALQLSMSSLIARAEEGEEWADPATGYRRRALATIDDFGVDVTEVVLPPNAEIEFPASAYAFNRHLIWVVKGELELVDGAQLHTLAVGESRRLDDARDRRFANRAAVACRYLVILSPGPIRDE